MGLSSYVPLEIIARAARLGYCPPDVMEWFSTELRSVSSFCHLSPYMALAWFKVPGWSHHVPTGAIDLLAEQYPGLALQLCPDRLSEKRFDHCVKVSPLLAVRFGPDRLNDTQVKWLATEHPEDLLGYAAYRCTQEQLDALQVRFPELVDRFRATTKTSLDKYADSSMAT